MFPPPEDLLPPFLEGLTTLSCTVTLIVAVFPPSTGVAVTEHVPAFLPVILIDVPDVTVATFISEDVPITDLFASEGNISNFIVALLPTFMLTLFWLGVILATCLFPLPLEFLLSRLSTSLGFSEFPL